jgi:hypothetical protein
VGAPFARHRIEPERVIMFTLLNSHNDQAAGNFTIQRASTRKKLAFSISLGDSHFQNNFSTKGIFVNILKRPGRKRRPWRQTRYARDRRRAGN